MCLQKKIVKVALLSDMAEDLFFIFVPGLQCYFPYTTVLVTCCCHPSLLVGKFTEGASQLVKFQSAQSLPHLTLWRCWSRTTGVLGHSVFPWSVSYAFFGLCAPLWSVAPHNGVYEFLSLCKRFCKGFSLLLCGLFAVLNLGCNFPLGLVTQSGIIHTINMACKIAYNYTLDVCSIRGSLLPYSLLVWAASKLLLGRWSNLVQLLYFSLVFVGALVLLNFSFVQLVLYLPRNTLLGVSLRMCGAEKVCFLPRPFLYWVQISISWRHKSFKLFTDSMEAGGGKKFVVIGRLISIAFSRHFTWLPLSSAMCFGDPSYMITNISKYTCWYSTIPMTGPTAVTILCLICAASGILSQRHVHSSAAILILVTLRSTSLGHSSDPFQGGCLNSVLAVLVYRKAFHKLLLIPVHQLSDNQNY